MTLVIEDMLRETRAGLMEAVVVGPGKAILFYGRCSLGEGLKADEARDAAFLLTGAWNLSRKIGLPHPRPYDVTRG